MRTANRDRKLAVSNFEHIQSLKRLYSAVCQRLDTSVNQLKNELKCPINVRVRFQTESLNGAVWQYLKRKGTTGKGKDNGAKAPARRAQKRPTPPPSWICPFLPVCPLPRRFSHLSLNFICVLTVIQTWLDVDRRSSIRIHPFLPLRGLSLAWDQALMYSLS